MKTFLYTDVMENGKLIPSEDMAYRAIQHLLNCQNEALGRRKRIVRQNRIPLGSDTIQVKGRSYRAVVYRVRAKEYLFHVKEGVTETELEIPEELAGYAGSIGQYLNQKPGFFSMVSVKLNWRSNN